MRRDWTWTLAALFVLAACSSGSTSTSTSPAAIPGGTVAVRITGGWTHIDPQHPTLTAGQQASAIIYSFYDSLIDIGPNGKLVPYLAKSWEQTPTSIKFTLRNDATCADGTKITPTVVKNSWERGLKRQGAINFVGPGPFSLSADDVAGTFTWSTQTPFTDALYNFAGPTGAIVCPAGLANPTGLQTTPQGSGPYVPVEAVPGDHFTVKLRTDWKWGPGGLTAQSPGLPEQITFKVVTNETTAANLLVTGGLDLGLVAGPDVDRLLANKDLTNKKVIAPQSFNLVFNHSSGRPTADPKVREALMSAIDRNAWNRIVYKDRGFSGPSFLGPTADCYDASVAQYLPKNPSPDNAKKILLAAGWTVGANGKLEKNGQPLVINFVATTAAVGSGPDYLDSVWDSAGITVKYDVLDFNSWLQRQLKSDFDALVQQYSSDTPNPEGAIQAFLGPTPPAGLNLPKTTDPEAEMELKLAQTTVGTERCKHWSNVQRLLLQNFNLLPLAAPATQWFSRGLDFLPGVAVVNARYIKRVKR